MEKLPVSIEKRKDAPAPKNYSERRHEGEALKRKLKAILQVMALLASGAVFDEGVNFVVRENKAKAETAAKFFEKEANKRIEKNLSRVFGKWQEKYSSKSFGESKNAENIPLTIEPLQALDGRLDEADIRGFVDTLPKEWINGKVSAIKNNQDSKGITVNLADGKAEASAIFYDERKIVSFYRKTKKLNAHELIEFLEHEISHANDWEKNENLTASERLDLETRLLGRLLSENRYNSEYAESVVGDTPEETPYLKMKEYWAEICSVYFSRPEDLNIADFLIVDSIVRRTSGEDYIPYEASARREEIVTEIKNRAKIQK